MAGNALILAAIWKNTSLRTPSYILLAGLAATDFATGLITQPFYAAYIFAGKNCIVSVIADMASRYFATVTAETITVMSIERWLHMSRRSFRSDCAVCVHDSWSARVSSSSTSGSPNLAGICRILSRAMGACSPRNFQFNLLYNNNLVLL